MNINKNNKWVFLSGSYIRNCVIITAISLMNIKFTYWITNPNKFSYKCQIKFTISNTTN